MRISIISRALSRRCPPYFLSQSQSPHKASRVDHGVGPKHFRPEAFQPSCASSELCEFIYELFFLPGRGVCIHMHSEPDVFLIIFCSPWSCSDFWVVQAFIHYTLTNSASSTASPGNSTYTGGNSTYSPVFSPVADTYMRR